MSADLTPIRAITPQATEIDAPVHLIRDPADARPLDMAHVANLAVSIQEVGLDHAIGLRLLKPEEKGDDGCLWIRTRGGHRLAAVRLLGRKTIQAKVRDEKAEVAAMAEVDENLLRRDLTPLERAQAFAARLEAWAVLNPDRIVVPDGVTRGKQGRPARNSDKLSEFLGGRPPLMGFARETAEQAGLSTRSVERALTVYRGIPAGQQARLHGTWIAKNDAVLRQIAALGEPEEQAKVIDQLLAGKTKNVAEAQALAAGRTPAAKTPSNAVQTDFQRAWKAATPSQRDGLLHWLSGQALPKGWTVTNGGEG